MNTFLKVVLVVLGALLTMKFLPELFAFGCLLAGSLLGLVLVGIPLLGVICAGVLAVAVVLAPLWVPVLLIVGLVALLRRGRRAVS